MNRRMNLLFAAFVGITLLMPIIAGNSIGTPTVVQKHSVSGMSEPPATIEFMASYINAWGGVTNAIVSMQNETHYDYAYINTLDAIVANQRDNEDGYVAQSTLEVSGMTPFPNGAVGPSMISVQLVVNPIVVVPANRDDTYITNLSISEAISLADEVIAVYDSVFGITLERLSTRQHDIYYYTDFDPYVSLQGSAYNLQYVYMFNDLSAGEAAVTTMLERLANMGGFMSIVGADGWSGILTAATESYFAPVWLENYEYMGGGVFGMMSGTGNIYVRADSSHLDLGSIEQTLIIGGATFMEPGYIQAGAGDETYSLKTHVGFADNIQNKMAEDPSAPSASIIAGFAPASLDISGLPTSWVTIDDQFEVPDDIILPGGHTIPANSTVSDVIKAYLSYIPREFAYGVNEALGSLDPTMFDSAIDSLWGGVGPYPDLKQSVLSYDFDTFPDTSLKEVNFDLLAQIMEAAGLTPSALLDNIDPDLADANPVAALVKAFVEYFDSYGMLDILDNDIYADPAALEAYLGTFGAGFVQVVHDLVGIDLPTSIQTREGLNDFVQEHWEITLGALWTAMANDDLTAIKNAVHNILDAENLQRHIVPYLMADLGASLVTGIGFKIAINIDETFSNYQTIDVSDLVLTFDADPESITFDGPYLVVTKGASNRTVPLDSTIDFTITVHNYGSATAYDVKVIDGINAGLDGDREAYWTRDTLAAGETWTINYQVAADKAGLFQDMQAICVYFNTTIDSFDPYNAEDWVGSAFYTWSAPGYQILITSAGGGFWDAIPSELFGIPTLYVAAGAGGVALIGVALLVVRRR